ncbi:MAG: flagellar filament capping protein FliD [Ruminococcus sp.]|nr:flagellar filament capping protein FliD [Ruminococcus sp.]
MAIGGLTSSTSSSIRGYGGLASGLDRDTLIEGMVYGTTSKITQQEQKKTQLEWKQTAVQNISDMMIAFANKFTDSLTSPTNLFSSVFWGRTQISTTGENAKYVSVTGNASSAEAITIMGVKQLAEKAKWTSSANVSNQTLESGQITKEMMDANYDVQHLVGKNLEFKVGAESYSLYLKSTDKDGNAYDYSTADGIAKAINEQLADITVGGEGSGKNLGQYVKVTSAGDEIVFSGIKDEGNKLMLTGGSAVGLLGFNSPAGDDGWDLANSGFIRGEVDKDKLVTEIDFDHKIAGKQLTFSYNGTSKNIYMPSVEELKDGVTKKIEEAAAKGETMTSEEAKMDVIKESLQNQLNAAFGKGRIEVSNKDGKLSFKTMDPSQAGKEDKTSTFSLVSGSEDLVGANGILGIKAGESNRVNLNASWEKSGLDLSKVKFDQEEVVKDAEGNIVYKEGTTDPVTRNKTSFTLNGKEIAVYEDDTMSSLMDRINNSGAGVKLTYQSAADKFTFTSTENGASGAVEMKGNGDLLNGLFGVNNDTPDANGDVSVDIRGKDAIVAVKYNGSDEVVELIRDSNSFTVDGLTIGVKGKFGYQGDTVDTIDKDAAVGIDARVNTDNIVDSIKDMVEQYNKIVDLVNSELTTRPDKEYAPLTSEQKKELTESEIKLYEEKAKSGMLYGDSDLRTLSSDLRFVVSGGMAEALKNIGITTSTLYSDNGKLTLDESKLRAMLEADPEAVEKAFTTKSGNENQNGLATNLKNVMDKYVKTMGSMQNKGILIRKAGSKSSPMSLTENALYDQIKAVKEAITKLNTRLETERDRYIAQFTSLETLISQMNSQSSWLSQFGG